MYLILFIFIYLTLLHLPLLLYEQQEQQEQDKLLPVHNLETFRKPPKDTHNAPNK